MAEDLVQPQNNVRALPRFRYLIDIVVLVAVTFLLDAVLGAFIPAPISLQRGLCSTRLGKCCWSELHGD